MMKSNIYNKVSKTVRNYILLLLAPCSLLLAGCNDFLDELPDNRTEANTESNIQKLLVAAYPTHDHMAFTEYASDNVDDMGENNPNSTRFLDQCYKWIDITESNNQDPRRYWMDLYQCIETANMALEGIESIGGATTTTLREAKAEALLCRAYAHFMLVNLFALHYDPNDDTSLGVSYVTATEKELNPKYQRETVKENYAHIQEDIEAALPYVGDSYYTVPKYHFNKNAANAFACRFYLYIGEYSKAIHCANLVLGSNAVTMLRNYKYIESLPREWNAGEGAIPMFMINANQNSNILLQTSYSSQQQFFGPYYTGKRYSHCAYIGTNETISAVAALWGGDYTSYYAQVFRYSGANLNAWVTWRLPWLFEEIDALGNGYSHTVHGMFTSDEVLLDRAEAYILTNQYDLAAQDLTIWAQNIAKTTRALTPASIQTFMNALPYSYDLDDGETITEKGGITSTIKKHLNPKFSIDEEGSIQESMLQAVIAMRRVETLHEGKRWFDIKRWGIEIPRRLMNSSGTPVGIYDWLTVDDPRRAIQIPQDVISAGYEPNPRATADDSGENLIPDEYLQK